MDAESSGATTVVRLSGDLTRPEIPALEARLLESARAPGVTRLVLDLSAVEFLDSAGITMLIRLKRRSAGEGFDVGVTGLAGVVRARLDRTGLLTLLLADEAALEPPPLPG